MSDFDKVLAVELHRDCAFGNEHIHRMRSHKTNETVDTCHECWSVAIDVAESKALAAHVRAERSGALREAANRAVRPESPLRYTLRDWLNDLADRIEASDE